MLLAVVEKRGTEMSEENGDYSIVIQDWRALARLVLLVPLTALCAYAIVVLMLALVMSPENYEKVQPWWKAPKLITMQQHRCTDFMWQEMPPACREALARQVLDVPTAASGGKGAPIEDPSFVPGGNNRIRTAPNTGMTGEAPVKELKCEPGAPCDNK